LALFGIFAMHGWGTHGTGHESAHDAMAMAPLPAVAGTTPHVHSDVVTPDSGKPPSGSGHGMASLCLAVLAGLIAAVVLIVQRRASVWLPWSMQVAEWQSATHGRDRDPPSLARLRVIRC